MITKRATAKVSTSIPKTKRKLNSAAGSSVDRATLLEVADLLTGQAQRLAASAEARLDMPLEETSAESQANTKMLLDWVADIYSIASDINAYLNPEE